MTDITVQLVSLNVSLQYPLYKTNFSGSSKPTWLLEGMSATTNIRQILPIDPILSWEPHYLVIRVSADMLVHMYTVNPLYCGHLGDLAKCPVYTGVLNSGIYLHEHNSFLQRCPYFSGDL